MTWNVVFVGLLASCSGVAEDEDGDGWTVADGDCDDDDPALYPGATDTPADGIDQDCDGRDALEDGDRALADADVVLRGGDPDRFVGTAVAAGGDLDGDGLGDLAAGGPGGTEDSEEGVVHVWAGPVAGSPTTTLIGDEAFAIFGYTLAASDLDGDGQDDLVVGAPSSNEARAQSGAVYLFLGPLPSGEVGRLDADAFVAGGDAGGATGSGLVALGDTDGDGIDDLAVGSPMLNADRPGYVDVWLGPVDLTSPPDATLLGEQLGDRTGQHMAFAGDVDADGYADALISALEWGDDQQGKLWLAHGPLRAASLVDVADAIEGVEPLDYAGSSAAVGDVDGDGGLDLLVGGHYSSAAVEHGGQAWLFTTPPRGRITVADAAEVYRGDTRWGFAGWAVAIDGGEPMIATPGHDGEIPGFIHFWDGGIAGAPVGRLVGEAPGDGAGYALATDGDVTGDAVADLVVTAPRSSAAATNGGAVYVIDGGL